MKRPEEILAVVKEFPTLPTIYNELSEVMANPRSTIDDAARIISTDQASASKVLKAANSSIYALRVNVDTVTQAIFYIGFDEVRNLINALAVIDIFNETSGNSNINPVEIWKHSIAVGVITRLLGKELGIRNLENYFISGILHDIGKLFFYKYLPEEFAKAIEYSNDKDISVLQAERELLGMSHLNAGELLAEKWKLPRNIRNAISYHTSGLVDGKVNNLVSCVHLADITASILNLGNSLDSIISKPNPKIWDQLGFADNTFSKIYDDIISSYNDSVKLLLRN